MPLAFLALKPDIGAQGTGLEWMPVAAVLLPILFLLVLMYVGSRRTV